MLATAMSIILGLAACGGDDGAKVGETETATPRTQAPVTNTALATVTATPPGSTTPVQPTPERTPRPSGNDLIDAVVTAVEANDANALGGLLHYFLLECTGGSAPDAVPCPAGQPAGTAVPVVGIGDCEGHFAQDGDEALAAALKRFVTEPPQRLLWAVVMTQPFPGDERVPGSFMVIFRDTGAGPGDSPASALSVDQEGVTYVHFGCGPVSTPESFAHGSEQYLVAPEPG